MSETIKLVTVATHKTDELNRFKESATHYGFDYQILGLGMEWSGGEAVNGRLVFPGGGMKVNLLKEYLTTQDDDTIILFTDSYDVVFSGGPKDVLKNWDGEGVLFTAEKTCWPDTNLIEKYPNSKTDYRFLNSGGFIGRVSDLKVLTETPCENTDDDQLYYTLKFLNGEGIKLDYNLDIFQTLNESTEDVEINDGYVHNIITDTHPTVIHANGGVSVRTFLNTLYNDMNQPINYTIDVTGKDKVLVQVIFDDDHSNPSVIMDSIGYLTYDKSLIDLYVINNSLRNHWEITNFIKKCGEQYNSTDYHYLEGESTFVLRDRAIFAVRNYKVSNVLVMDSNYYVKNHDTIQILLGENKSIVAPMLNTEQSLESNFWCGVDEYGYFREHDNYFKYRDYEKVGTFNVPFVKGVIMFDYETITSNKYLELYVRTKDESYGNDHFVILCNHIRSLNHFMFVTNKRYFGKFLQ